MAILLPSALETALYGADGWNAIYSTNFEKINNYLGCALNPTQTKQADVSIISSGKVYTVKAFDVRNSDDSLIFRIRSDGKMSIGMDLNGQYSETFCCKGLGAYFPVSGDRGGIVLHNPAAGDVTFFGYQDSSCPYGPAWASSSVCYIRFPTAEALRIGSYASSTSFIEIASSGDIGVSRTPSYAFDGPDARFGDTSNYAKFDTDGTLTLTGNATAWGEITKEALDMKLGGSHDPTFTQFRKLAGSPGVYTYYFDPDVEEELFFTLPIPSDYKEGSTVYPYVYWSPSGTADGSPTHQKVKWGLEYSWGNVNGLFPDTATIYGDTPTQDDDPIVGFTHYLTPIDSGISGSGKTIFSRICCRLFRQAADGADTYEQDAALISFALRYEKDSLGSKTLTAK